MTNTVPRHRRQPWHDTSTGRAVTQLAAWAAWWSVIVGVLWLVFAWVV
jgi:hypothetical protein